MAVAVPAAALGALRRQLPTLRREWNNRRIVGELAVREGRRRVEQLFDKVDQAGEADDTSPTTPDAARGASDTGVATPTGAPAGLPADIAAGAAPPAVAAGVDDVPPVPRALDDYASLAASQVVARLEALSAPERAEVAAYERATRRRRTILSAIDRLDG